MQTNSNAPQPYFLQRPNSPKSPLGSTSNKNISLTLSIGANQSPSHLVSKFTPTQPPLEQTHFSLEKLEQELRVSAKENSILKEENSQLRR
jgi:hypothetical protein